MNKQIPLFLTLFMAALSTTAIANNLSISGVNLTNDSTINFNISWDNSWRVSVAPNNHDAVWVFVKIKECASNQWSHVDLSSTLGDHTAAAPLEVFLDGKDAGANAKGVFLRRSADGIGNISATSISLRMPGLAPGQYDFRVMGIEMVQVVGGSFQIGDGNVSTGSFKNGSTSNPFTVISEGAITVGTGAGNLYTSSTTYRPVSLPANYPKGFAEFYIMKYELSQGQYVDFINMLTSDQAATRIVTGTASRLNITGAWPVVSANAPHRAMNFLAWADMLAYLDWSALRPMTELEYEKACRGPATPVGSERAWGTNTITDGNTVVTDGTPTETVSNPVTPGSGMANYNNSTILGPLRCGFAAKVGTDRYQAGASYYGGMEMSGNVWEQTVTTRNATGSAFNGTLGDGELSVSPSAGFANAPTWPNPQASTASTTSVTGRAFRGGSWADIAARLGVSDRFSINSLDGRRINSFGGRGVR